MNNDFDRCHRSAHISSTEEPNKWCLNTLPRLDPPEFRLPIYPRTNVVCKIPEVLGALLAIFLFHKKKDNILRMRKNVLIFLLTHRLSNIHLLSGNASVTGKENVKFEFDIIPCEHLRN